MTKTHLLVAAFILAGWKQPSAPSFLFPYKQGETWGYLDAHGTVVIQPGFRAVKQYTEELAAVRKNGYYGYIDAAGKLVISWQFDYAEPFQGQTARVFIGPKPYVIDKKGKILFEHSYESIELTDDDNIFIVETASHHYGIVDRTGHLIADTMYNNIEPFQEGYAEVEGLKHDRYAERGKTKYQVGLINCKGELVIPFGKFSHIEKFNEGIATAYLMKGIKTKSGSKTEHVYIDIAGNILFAADDNQFQIDYHTDDFHQQLFPVTIPMKRKIPGTDDRDFYAGVINPRGQIAFSDSTWEEVSYFSDNRAFARLKTGGWRMIDLQGKLVGTDVYDQVITLNERTQHKQTAFLGNKCWVLGGKEISAIDTNGKTIVPRRSLNFEFDEIIQYGQWLLFKEDISDKDEEYSYLYGLYNCSTGLLIEPSFFNINLNEPDALLLRVQTRKSWGYINQQGKMIWEESRNNTDSMAQLHIDHMTRGFYYAYSPYINGHSGFGGHGGSNNGVREIQQNELFSKGRLELIIDTNESASWRKSYAAIKTFVANSSTDTIFFEAQDSRLYMKMQAMDSNGEWRDIEYLPNSWCGNSYHRLHLAPGQYWEFKTPVYHGELKTKLRLQLKYKKTRNKKEQQILYSNTIDGYINPGQFWRKNGYRPGGLMDPYVD